MILQILDSLVWFQKLKNKTQVPLSGYHEINLHYLVRLWCQCKGNGRVHFTFLWLHILTFTFLWVFSGVLFFKIKNKVFDFFQEKFLKKLWHDRFNLTHTFLKKKKEKKKKLNFYINKWHCDNVNMSLMTLW